MSRLLSTAKNFSKDSSFVTYESSSATLDFTLSASFSTVSNFEYELLDVRLHLASAATPTENFTITLDATRGTPYDVVFYTKDMASVSDVVWAPDEPLYFAVDDKLNFEWANTETKEFGLAVRYRRLT